MNRPYRAPALLLSASLAAAMALPAAAEEFPEINYGMWETTTVSSMKSDAMNLPETTNTASACVTREDVEEGRAFLQNQDNCKVIEQSMTKSSMDMAMICNQSGTGEMTMNVSMQYEGDTMSGQIDGEVDSPMGKMTLLIKLSGKRTGDC